MGKKYKRVKKALSKGLQSFDIDDPELPKAVDEAALTSGGFPYDRKLDKDTYETELMNLQIELVKLQASLLARGERLVVLFEGRDAAGKGSAIKRFTAHLNARRAHTVALAKRTSEPGNLNVIIPELSQLLFPIPLTEKQHQYLKDILLDGAPVSGFTSGARNSHSTARTS